MALFLIFLGFCFVNSILCYDSDGSSELNRIEFTPLYETIIYSDIADIIKDFENNMNSPLETFINNDESESDENIDELLAEYQHYLDKAHKQRKSFLENSNPIKKVPLLSRDKYSKSKSILTNKHNDFYSHNTKNYNQGEMKFPQSEFKTPIELLLPMNTIQSSYYNNYENDGTNLKEKSLKKAPFFQTDQKMLPLPPASLFTMREPIKSSCFCEPDTLCECGCKQCLVLEPMLRKQFNQDKLVSPSVFSQNNNDLSLNDLRTMTDTLNIRINVDVQLPNFQETISKLVKNTSSDQIAEPGSSISKESNINLPFPYFNFPMPLEMFGFKKANQDSAPIHKITIHRKKKSKTNSNGKRHRKKLISFHNIKLESQQSAQPSLDENYNTSDYQQKTDNNFQINLTNRTYNLTHKTEQGNITTNNTAESPSIINDTKTDDSVYLMVNIRNNADNITENVHRNDNSIEVDYTRGFVNSSTEKPTLRKKRDASNQNISTSEDKMTEFKNKTEIINVTSKDINLTKKGDKMFTDDAELLFWPNNSNGLSSVNTRNITTIIIDTENKKVKLNLSSEAIRHNQTKALEQAIFGDVNWNDVGTVAPVFMSFMGKYIRGVLTFCSESTCHSMKCADKSCVHRTCAPSDRFNNKGHCAGYNTADSVASLEAIMDLPSNVALEIVDILQDRMLGNLFGKATLCISSKCVTFVASKKSFLKTKCTSKDLNVIGHCTNIKNVKIM